MQKMLLFIDDVHDPDRASLKVLKKVVGRKIHRGAVHDLLNGQVLGAKVVSLRLEATKLFLSKSTLFSAFGMVMTECRDEGRRSSHISICIGRTRMKRKATFERS